MPHKGPQHHLSFTQAAKEQMGSSTLERPFDDILPGAEETQTIEDYIYVRPLLQLNCRAFCALWPSMCPANHKFPSE